MIVALLYLEVVGVESIALKINFDIFVSLYSPVPGLLFYLVIDVELMQEGLYISLILGK